MNTILHIVTITLPMNINQVANGVVNVNEY